MESTPPRLIWHRSPISTFSDYECNFSLLLSRTLSLPRKLVASTSQAENERQSRLLVP